MGSAIENYPSKYPSVSYFRSRINHGISSREHIVFLCFCIGITVCLLMNYGIGVFGSPFKFNNAPYDAISNHKYRYKDSICRNKIRILGNGYPIDSCYRPIKLTKYISDKEKAKDYEKNYLKHRRKGRSAHDASVFALQEIDPRLNMDSNWRHEKQNKDEVVTDAIEWNMCDYFNDFLADSTKKHCTQETITSKV